MRSGAAIAIATVLVLSGCSTQSGEANLATPPSEASALAAHLPPDYRQVIVDDFRNWPDYQGVVIKDATISSGKTQFGDILNGGTTATVCVRYKTRGTFGGEGYATESFFFTHRRLAHGGLRERRSAALLSCGSDRVYGPFPEANKA
jgi:hypothetical protein